jgi:hypothetical protein
MADSSIFFTWGAPVLGRENQGLEVFQEALNFWEKKKGEGVIEDYKVGVTENGDFGRTAGYMVVEGEQKKITELMHSQEHRRLVMRAMHIVENMTMCQCATGTAIPGRMEQLVNVRKELGIS